MKSFFKHAVLASCGVCGFAKYVPKDGGVCFDKDLVSAEDETLTLKGVSPAVSVTLLGEKQSVQHDYSNGTLTIHLPASRRTKMSDVVSVGLVP